MTISKNTPLTSNSSNVTIGKVQRVAEAAWRVLNHDNDPHSGLADDTANWHALTRAIRAELEKPTSNETSELQRALHVIDEAGKLSDWINRARPVVTDLMSAYERRIRTDCTPEQLAKEPWRCMEYIGAESLLRDQPIAVVELTAQKAGEPQPK